MDRDELQERIRARRSGGEPYRRGAMPADEYGGYERFEPDPTDAHARRSGAPDDRRRDYLAQDDEDAGSAGGGGHRQPEPGHRAEEAPDAGPAHGAAVAHDAGMARDPGPPRHAGVAPQGGVEENLPPLPRSAVRRAEEARRPDLTRDRDDWSAPGPTSRAAPPPKPRPVVPVPAPPPAAPGPAAPTADYSDYAARPRADHLDDQSYDPEAPYEYDQWEDDRERRSGVGGLAILGFLALGVLALLGGAVLAGVFTGDPGVAEASPTPFAAVSEAPLPSVAASVAASAAASALPTGSSAPSESGAPVVFPDGFTAQAQPCIPGSVRPDGCDSSGAVNSGQVEIWVGFENGTSADVVGAEILGPDGNTIGEGTIDLSRIGCTSTCNGHTYFNFANLGPGMYEVRITRNGEQADTIEFEVS